MTRKQLYYQSNKETIKAQAAAYKKAHPDRVKATRRKYRSRPEVKEKEYRQKRIRERKAREKIETEMSSWWGKIEIACLRVKEMEYKWLRRQEVKYYAAKRGVELYLLKRATRHIQVWRVPEMRSEEERRLRKKFSGVPHGK